MRVILHSLIVAIAALPIPAIAQSAPSPASTYELRAAIDVAECTFEGKQEKREYVQAPRGAKFRFLRTSKSAEDSLVIQFLDWKPTSPFFYRLNVDQAAFSKALADRGLDLTKSTDAKASRAEAAAVPRRYFCIGREDFGSLSRESFGKGWSSRQLVVGALILPAKLRPSVGDTDFEFSKDLSIGTTAGLRLRTSEYRNEGISLVGGVALSSVTLTAENTRSASDFQSTDQPAFTWTLGALLDVDNFQFGFFVGQDRISQGNRLNWTHQGKFWYSLGLGYSLFGQQQPKPSQGN